MFKYLCRSKYCQCCSQGHNHKAKTKTEASSLKAKARTFEAKVKARSFGLSGIWFVLSISRGRVLVHNPRHVSDFVNAVAGLVQSNRMQLNNDKTEFMWCATVHWSNNRLIHFDAVFNGS